MASASPLSEDDDFERILGSEPKSRSDLSSAEQAPKRKRLKRVQEHLKSQATHVEVHKAASIV